MKLRIFLEKGTTKQDSLVAIPIVEMDKEYETHMIVPSRKSDLRLVSNFVNMVTDGQLISR